MKAKHGVLACEVCLEDMSNLEVVVKALREERRQQLRNRAAMLVLNGKKEGVHSSPRVSHLHSGFFF